MTVFEDTRKLATAMGLRLPPTLTDVEIGIVVRTATGRITSMAANAEKFRQLKAAWEGPGGDPDWLEFCQDFDWEEP